jgi:hypothetical protein
MTAYLDLEGLGFFEKLRIKNFEKSEKNLKKNLKKI